MAFGRLLALFRQYSVLIFGLLVFAFTIDIVPALAFSRLRYILNEYSVLAFGLAAFVLTVAILPLYIYLVKKQQLAQFVREEGPQSHFAKAGTPTTGGACFMAATLVLSIGWLCYSRQLNTSLQTNNLPVVVVLVVALFCGLLGLIDDLAKIQKRANKGISARARLIIEAFIGLTASIVLVFHHEPFVVMPLFQGTGTIINYPIPTIFYVLLGLFLVAATTNALNLHDGMDGLAAGTAASVFTTLAVLFSLLGNTNLAVIAAIGAGSVCGFLMFNHYPAKIFMGDTGSLFIGGLMAALTLSGGLIFWFIPLSCIYIAETLSVMMQVIWFKLTKPYTPEKPMSPLALIWLKLTKRLPGEGQRLFRMAPLHHHFESLFAEKGIAEWQVAAGFWFTQVIICFLVLMLFFKL